MRLIITLLLIGAIAATAHAATFHVDCAGGADFSTIQGAVAAAADGDTVVVEECIYEEHVAVTGKNLVFIGAGSTTTQLTWPGSEHTIRFTNHPLSEYGKSRITDMTVRAAGSGFSIKCEYGTVVLERCVAQGAVAVGGETWNGIVDGDVEAYDCTLGRVYVWGFDVHPSILQDCAIDMLRSSGSSDPSGSSTDALVHSSNSGIDVFQVYGGTVRSVGDSIGVVVIVERMTCVSDFASEDSRIGRLGADGGGIVSLTGCTIGSMLFAGFERANLEITGSLVLGSSQLYNYLPYYEAGIRVVHATFAGDLELYGGMDGSNVELTSSVVAGQLEGSGGFNTLIRNNCFGVASLFAGGVLADNVVGDPLFCDPENGDYSVQECSPCRGAALDGGVSGAFDVGCPCASLVEMRSWGAVKALFRQPSN